MKRFLRYPVLLILLIAGCHSPAEEEEGEEKQQQASLNEPLPPPVAEVRPVARASFWASLPQPKGFINDYEDLFTDGEEHVLDSICTACKQQSSVELSVVTLDTTATPRAQFDSLVTHIGNAWGVGNRQKNNGVIIGLSKGYRLIRISTGDGIAKQLSNAQTKGIIEADILPYFRRSDYFGGTLHGVEGLMAQLQAKRK